ncbi:MAG: hypothetical protein AB7R90_01300 [Reyranellaceae bacterium]
MAGYYLWAAVIVVGVLALGGVMLFVSQRYEHTHKRRSAAEKRASAAVTKENYRDPVKHDPA